MGRTIAIIVLGMWASLTLAQTMTPAEAAEKARKQTGGKVIRISAYDSAKKGYSVRVLTAKGQVRTLFIADSSKK